MRQTSLRKLASPSGLRVDFIAFYSGIMAFVLAMFIALDISASGTTMWLVYLSQLIIGFFGTLMLTKPDLSFNAPKSLNTIIYSMITFGIISVMQLPIIFLLQQSTVYSINPYIPLFAPMSEEFFFRGFLMGAFSRVSGTSVDDIFAITVSASSFAIFHFYVGGLTSPVTLAILFMAGISYAVSYKLTGMLGVPIIAHLMNNSLVMFI